MARAVLVVVALFGSSPTSAGAGEEDTTRIGGALYHGKSVGELIRDLGHEDYRARQSAAEGLGYLGMEASQAVPALAAALDDEVHVVRLAVAHALRAMAPAARSAVPALTRALGDHLSDVRVEVAYALAGIGPDARLAVPALAQALGDRPVRLAAARALGSIGADAKSASAALEQALRDETDASVRNEIHWAIERVHWQEPAQRSSSRPESPEANEP